MNDTTMTTAETDPAPHAPPVVAAPTLAGSAITDIFGKPPLLKDEDANLYDALFSRVVAAARPRDAFEWMLLRDYADLAWEIFRLRRAKAALIDTNRRSALVTLAQKLGLDVVTAVKWYKDPDIKASILQHFADHGLDEEVVTHEAVVLSRPGLISFDGMIASAEQRRNAMLREIDCHRVGLGGRLRGAPDVVDAEIEDVPAAARAEAHPA
ncbi:MAG TPA: hypothetical protein VK456_01015 [Xanthobacteraceae bacterium]|nr:hypothetical protein [Xanthobacteraceae bacterium]